MILMVAKTRIHFLPTKWYRLSTHHLKLRISAAVHETGIGMPAFPTAERSSILFTPL
jgi:hypothetical protein